MKLNLRSIDLNLLTIFSAIMTENQMSRAAEQLHMTQPAVSHALARLRLTFNDELFVRTRRGMVPTPKALALAGPIMDALGQIQEVLHDDPPFDPETTQRVFRIAFTQYGELSLLPDLLGKLGSNPGIAIESVVENHHDPLERVREFEIDFCFDVEVPRDDSLACCLCGKEEWVVIASKHHPRLRSSITPAEYFSERHVVLALQGQRKQFVQQTMQALGGKRKILAEVQQYVAIPTLVMQCEGIATVPKRLVDYSLYHDRLTILEMPLSLPATPYYLIWHSAMSRNQGHLWMKQRIQEAAHC